MKIKIIPEKCIACGLCHLYAPEVFDYDDAGIVRFYRDENLESGEEKLAKRFSKDYGSIRKAVRHCPTKALVEYE